MIELRTILWVWQTQASGRWYFLSIAEEKSAEIRAAAFAGLRGFGSVRVEATINGVTWRTSVFPQKSGGYILPVKADVRRKAHIATGEEVRVELELL